MSSSRGVIAASSPRALGLRHLEEVQALPGALFAWPRSLERQPPPLGQARPSARIHSKDVDAISARGAVLPGNDAGKRQGRRIRPSRKRVEDGRYGGATADQAYRPSGPQALRQAVFEKAILRSEGKMNLAQSAQSHVAEALTDRVADHQCANQGRAANRGAEHHTQVRPGMEAEVAANERPEGHAEQARRHAATAIVEYVRRPREFLGMNCRAKRLECVQLAGAFFGRGPVQKREQAPRTPNASRNSVVAPPRCALCASCPCS